MHITHYYSVINFMQKGQQTRDHISLQKPFDDVSQLPVTLDTNLGNYYKGLNLRKATTAIYFPRLINCWTLLFSFICMDF